MGPAADGVKPPNPAGLSAESNPGFWPAGLAREPIWSCVALCRQSAGPETPQPHARTPAGAELHHQPFAGLPMTRIGALCSSSSTTFSGTSIPEWIRRSGLATGPSQDRRARDGGLQRLFACPKSAPPEPVPCRTVPARRWSPLLRLPVGWLVARSRPAAALPFRRGLGAVIPASRFRGPGAFIRSSIVAAPPQRTPGGGGWMPQRCASTMADACDVNEQGLALQGHDGWSS